MTTKINKIISAVVAIAIIVAIIILVYVNLPRQTDTSPEENTPPETNPTIFTLYYGGKQTNFSMAELERLEPYTAKGGYRKQSGTIAGWGNYTGVNITTLVNTIEPTIFQYSLIVVSEDGNHSYNYSTIMGNVDIYNPDNGSDPIGKGNMTMVLAYQFEGDWLDEESDGKLRIVFLDEQGFATQSSLWQKKVISIHIITE
jgi:hypothetical protein